MPNNIKDDELEEIAGGKHIPYNKEEVEETIFSFTYGETIYSSMYSYYFVKQTGSFKYDDDVVCDSYAYTIDGGFELSEKDVKLKATVLNTFRNKDI